MQLWQVNGKTKHYVTLEIRTISVNTSMYSIIGMSLFTLIKQSNLFVNLNLVELET